MSEDMFAPPVRNRFPNMDDLEGALVLITPKCVETVSGYMGVGTTERATVDVVVFGPDGEEEYTDKYMSQAGIVTACKAALRPGSKPMILGVVAMYPTKDGKAAGFDTVEKIKQGLLDHFASNGKKKKPNFGWHLEEYTEEQAEIARNYLASLPPPDDMFAKHS
jgi:hypothetical protein